MPTAKERLDQEPWRPLSIGAVSGGGPATDAVVREISTLARCVRRAVEGLGPGDDANQAAVNVVFHVPGPLLSPDYEGMRTGSWIGKRRLQVVQVAVPSDLGDPAEVTEFLASNLESAVPLAAERIGRFRRSSDLLTSKAAAAAATAAAEMRSRTNR
jgi:hypothetical protein